MNVCINGEPGGVTLEGEKTAGEVLSALEEWLRSGGHRLSGILIDGEKIGASSIEGIFDRSVENIAVMDILTSSWAELACDALTSLYDDILGFEGCPFDGRAAFAQKWRNSAGAAFLSQELPDTFRDASAFFDGQGFAAAEFRGIVEERLRELADPAAEMARLGSLVNALIPRLEDMPLDFQTGKDMNAAETMSLFSAVSEKFFRLYGFMKAEGVEAALKPELNTAVDEFNTALKELAAAYEANDVVLAGDIAEYELAPRLGALYQTVTEGVST